jgi:hypothetical protein
MEMILKLFFKTRRITSDASFVAALHGSTKSGARFGYAYM